MSIGDTRDRRTSRTRKLGRTIHLGSGSIRFGWSRDFEPAATVSSGSELGVDVVDASAGQLGIGSTAEDILKLDFARVNPVSGPVFVEGARPGDVLEVAILEMSPSRLGWTAVIPGFGLLADQFPDPWLHVWDLESGRANFLDGLSVPIKPMCGVLGVAPAESGIHSVVPPRRVGGNLDISQLGVGATLWLPVEVEGALFGIGDTHAAQGDGEVCGTAIESAFATTVRLTVRRDMKIDAPEFELPGMPVDPVGPVHACTGVGPDLMEAAREATRSMVHHIERAFGLDSPAAYALCSVAVDLRISEIVDTPNWVVSAFLPNRISREY